MNKSLKKIAIAASAMIFVGILLAGIGFLAGGNQPIRIDRDGIHVGNGDDSDGRIESFTKELDSFSSINTDLDYYKVELIPGDQYAIEASYDGQYGKPSIKIENDTLIVKEKSQKKFHVNIDIFGLEFLSNKENLGVKIYYPKTANLKNIVIRADVSDLSFDNLNAETAEFDLDLGKLELSNLTAQKVKVKMDSGDCIVKKITADDLNMKIDLGKTTLEDANVKSLEIKSDSGDVSITDATIDSGDLKLELGKLTTKNLKSNGLKAENSSGDIELQGALLEITDVTCDMGKVTINTDVPKDQYDYELNTDIGKVTIEGESVSSSIALSNNAKNMLKINTDLGDINIHFK